jgi:hypothetical protein
MLGPQPLLFAQRDVQRVLDLAEILFLGRARERGKRRMDRVQAMPSIN